jgi:hypothetical protein
MSFDFGPHDQFALAAVVLIGTYAAAFALLWMSQKSPYTALIGSFRGIAQNFLTVINVIFALNLAFLANDTWNARDRALDAVYHEAGSLQNLMDLAGQLPDSLRSTLVTSVESYARLAVIEEWPRLARRDHDRAVGAQLDALVAFVASSEVTSTVAPAVVTQLLQQAVQVRNTRELRIALSQTHVNPLKWLGMIFLGFLTMISIAMVHVDHPRAQFLAVVLFATAAAPTAAIILIHGNPFQHPMAIASTPIAEIAAATAPAK